MAQYYKTSEAAKLLGCSIATVRRWDSAGKIKSIRSPSGYRLIPQSEIDRLLGKDEAEPNIIDTEELLRTPTYEDETHEEEIRDLARNIVKHISDDRRVNIVDLEKLAHLFRNIPNEKCRRLGEDIYRLVYALTEAEAEDERDRLIDIEEIVSHLTQIYPQKIEEVVKTLDSIYGNLQSTYNSFYLRYGEEIKNLIERLEQEQQKIILERQRREFEEKGAIIEEILRSKDLVDRILDSFGSVVCGNVDVLKNIVYDLALENAKPIKVGSKDTVLRTVRAHPAIWLWGKAGSGKGELINLIESVSQNAHRVSDLGESALKYGLLELAQNGVLLFPEADVIYKETRSGGISIAQAKVIAIIRQIIEDNFITFYRYDPRSQTTQPAYTYASTTLVMASTEAPREEQTRQRFVVYRLDRDLSLDIEVMDATALGAMGKLYNTSYDLETIRLLYSAVYFNAGQVRGVIIPEEFARILGSINYRLALLSLWKSEPRLRDEIDSLTVGSDDSIGSAVTQMMWHDFLMDHKNNVRGAPSYIRRQGDILRRIHASAYLHFLQREQEDGYIEANKDDVMAGVEFLKYIEKSERMTGF